MKMLMTLRIFSNKWHVYAGKKIQGTPQCVYVANLHVHY